MKPLMRLVSIAAFAAVVAVATPAFALEASGMITDVDVTTGTITLANMQKFKLSDVEVFKTIKLGDRVTVEYMMDGSTMVATTIQIAA